MPLDLTANLPTLLALFAFLVSLFSLVRKEAREDGQTTSQRLKKLESVSANHEVRHTGQEQASERLADHTRDAIAVHSREAERRFVALETATADVPRLREAMVRMEEKLKGIDKIEAKLDQLYALLTRPQK